MSETRFGQTCIPKALMEAWSREVNKRYRRRKGMERAHIEYLIKRLERTRELINNGDHHMAAAKLSADISALQGYLSDLDMRREAE